MSGERSCTQSSHYYLDEVDSFAERDRGILGAERK